MPMSFIFGGAAPTTAELAMRYKRHINRSIREIDRETIRLSNEEKHLMHEVKAVSRNNMKQSMQKAQAVVRLRRMLDKFSQMKAHLQGIGMRIQSVKSTEALQKAVGSAVQMMQSFNKVTGGNCLVGSLRELEKNNMLMSVQSELIDEHLDSVFDEDESEDTPADIVMQVMQEAGVELPVPGTNVVESLTFEERLERIKQGS